MIDFITEFFWPSRHTVLPCSGCGQLVGAAHAQQTIKGQTYHLACAPKEGPSK